MSSGDVESDDKVMGGELLRKPFEDSCMVPSIRPSR
jgi:hypothetical protein